MHNNHFSNRPWAIFSHLSTFTIHRGRNACHLCMKAQNGMLVVVQRFHVMIRTSHVMGVANIYSEMRIFDFFSSNCVIESIVCFLFVSYDHLVNYSLYFKGFNISQIRHMRLLNTFGFVYNPNGQSRQS